jgi:hypothetical protein
MNTICLLLTLWTAFAGKESKSISIPPPPCSPDYETLKAFYRATDGPHWTHTWDINDCTVTNWYGVYKDFNGRVTDLILTNNKLNGAIPASLGNLRNLRVLFLSNNNLLGNIPSEIGSLSNLLRLDFNHNRLTGSIPRSLGSLSNLLFLGFHHNQLTGNIPSELSRLSNLDYLGLYDNQLTGSIPTQIGNLTRLTFFGLSNNQLTGNILIQLSLLSNLKSLGLNNNHLTGSIPNELGNLQSLQELYLNNNQLTGCFPQNLQNLCNHLQHFNFLYNPGLPGGGDFASFCSSTLGSNSTTWYLDADHDDHASRDSISCDSPGTGYTTTRLPIDDCNDHNTSIHPGSPDYTCDGIDNDCDGLIDEDFTPMTCLTCLHGMMSYNAPANATFTIIQPTCTNPTGTITINNKAPLDSVSFDNGMTYQLSNTKSNLIPGNYMILIKNIYGCISLESTYAMVLTACVPVCINGLDSVYYNDDTHIVTPIGSPGGGFFKVDNAPLAGDYWLQHLSLGMHTVSYSIVIPPYTTVVSRQIRIRQ